MQTLKHLSITAILTILAPIAFAAVIALFVFSDTAIIVFLILAIAAAILYQFLAKRGIPH